MKLFTLAAALLLAAGALSAQPLPEGGPGGPGGQMGPGRPPVVDWKPGTSITMEYKALTGTLKADLQGPPVLTVSGLDYQLRAPRKAWDNLKVGDTVTVEGPVVTAVGVPGFQPSVEVFKLTAAGKTQDFHRDRGPGEDSAPSPRQ